VSGVLVSTASASEPFDSLEVGILGLADVSDTDYHNYWQRGVGGEIFAQTPFYLGSTRLGLRYTANSAQPNAGVPDSNNFFFYLGWSLLEFEMIRTRAFADLGISLGINQWDFEDETDPGLQEEAEIASEIFGRARLVFARRWNANVSLRYQTTYTHKRINVVYATLGVSRSMSMPGWLRGFLE